MTAQPLGGRTVIVTGASQGIGRVAALLLAGAGARLALLARSADRLATLVAEIEAAGGSALAFPCDLADRQQLHAAMVEAESSLGGVDVLINNAGTGVWATILETDEVEWEHQYQVNVHAPLYCIRAVLPGMIARRRGHIVNVGSVLEDVARPRSAAYCTTKAALAMLTDVLRLEVGSYNVRVSRVSPGLASTDFGGVTAAEKAEAGAMTPEAVAQTILHVLTMPEGANITNLRVEPGAPPQTRWAE